MIPRNGFKGSDLTKKKKTLRFLLFLLILCAVLLADSKCRLSCTEYELSATNLPEGFDGYRIVQLSDLHMAEFGTDNYRLVEQVAQLQPDLIALTGDSIEAACDIPIVEALIQQLVEIAPVYYSSGNHDWASGAIEELRQAVTDSGGTYLSNEYVVLRQNVDAIILAGVEDPNGHADMIKPDALMEQINLEYPGSFIILLAHRNDFVTKYPDLQCDLVFTGHGHGGVIRLPGVGGLLGTERSLFPEYDAGLFSSGRYTMVVSRGLGDAPMFPRFLNNPEIVCVTLHRK